VTQFNLQQTNSTGGATKVVSAGDPVTLVLNHSTKNTVYIGSSSSVGSGNLLDATPLDPYASIVVNGVQDVWAVAAVPTLEATVYTYQNAINWSPKAVQPNIVDPSSPWEPGAGVQNEIIAVPPGAQGLMISVVGGSVSQLEVIGQQSGLVYLNVVSPSNQQYWAPILSDADTTVRIFANSSSAPEILLVWIMNTLPVSVVNTGTPLNVSVSGTVQAAITNTPLPVNETNGQVYANQEAVNFDMTLAVGGLQSLLPASAGIQYKIHEFRVEPFTPGVSLYVELQDTSPLTFARLFQNVDGTPVNAYRPPMGSNNFHGMPVPTGLGVRLTNVGTVPMRVIGHLVYSQ
jgi:hypothetical protein